LAGAVVRQVSRFTPRNTYERRFEMAGPVYKLWMFRYTDAWYQLSEEERGAHYSKLLETYEKVGGKMVIACESAWSSEQWLMFGLDEFPDIEAAQKFAQLLIEQDHFRYIESVSMLGTKWEPS
jgi:hypothetical protein